MSNATCILAETRDMFASLVDGSSSLHTEPFDPMFLDYLHIDKGFKIDSRDNEVNGLKNAVIEEARFAYIHIYNIFSLYLQVYCVFGCGFH